MQNWSITEDGTPVTVTAVSAVTAIATGARRAVSNDVLIDNPGPADVYVRAGAADVVATLNSVRVPAGSLQPFSKGTCTHLAMITASGSQAVVVHVGDGE